MSKQREFVKELKDLLSKYDATLSVDFIGDTHGVMEDFVVDFKEKDRHQYQRIMLNEGYSYIDSPDLNKWLESTETI